MCKWQGRSQTFSFGGATGGASFATRGAVNGLCRTFRKSSENFLGGHWGARQNFGGAVAPPSSAPGKWANLLSNGAPKSNCNVQVLCFQMVRQTVTALCKYSTFKGTTIATAMCKSYTFREAQNSKCK